MTSKLRRGLLIVLVVAGAIALGAAMLPVLTPPPEPVDQEFEAFDPAETVSEPAAATGEIDPEPVDDEGLVVIDAGQANRFETADIQHLVEALDRIGYDTKIHSSGELNESLADADAFVVIDPESAYSSSTLDGIEAFVDEGGRLVIFGEPDRFEAEPGLLGGVVLNEVESDLLELGSRFDLYFETEYVYDTTENEGNFKNVLTEPHWAASLPPHDRERLETIDSVAFYTGTEVRSTGDGDPVLVTGPNARTVGSDVEREHTLAVRDGNVLGVGDSTFLGPDRYTVADNDVFLTAVVEFLVSGDRETGFAPGEAPEPLDPDDDEDVDENDEDDTDDEEDDTEDEDDDDGEENDGDDGNES